ncbi:LppX_LprAFG lipoprotein [Spirillospora albida]|uniref:LppX_LprAFG lipoprotein n=1 Tax=Spirillospora albida TaxID=58123 RepID=UPI0004BFD93E|nr:LppX_LprAFG lipoprotein [Spirillospora albida]
MFRRILALAPLSLALVATGACSGDGGDGGTKADFDAAQVVQRSATAMGNLKSVGFTVSSDGTTPIMVKGADMKLLRGGDAQGTLTIERSGQNVEMKVVALGPVIYLNPGTGGWQRLPKALAAGTYDPSAVLDPERGIAKLLGSVTGPRAEAEEKVNGKETYRVGVTLPKDRIAGLVPGIDSDLRGRLWVNKADNRLVKVRGQFPDGKGAVVIDCTEFDVPYKISAPR